MRLVAACTALALAAACSGTPTSPSQLGARTPRLTRTRFFAFGDSLTSGEITAPIAGLGGVHLTAIVPGRSYPEVLQSQLQAAYPAQSGSIEVANRGLGGETLYEGVVRFDRMFPPSRADVVLLQEGVNGLGFAGPDGSTAMMRVMVQEAKASGAKVFVGSMIPTLPNRQRTQNAAALLAYNDVLREMCTQEGVTYVDLYNGMLADADQLIGVDGLHPNEAGYRRIAEVFFSAIKRELEE